ncbi:reverse transcriptase domain-containing protein, partial [Tanacetum coccineum]
GYVAEEALTFSSHYFRDVTMKFNRPDRNVDYPPPTCQFQVFKSLCKSIGLRSVIRIDHQELKKVTWYVLHNCLEIDTYRAKFKSELPNKDMKEEFLGYQSNEIFALACGPSQTPISVNSCVVNGVRFVVHSRDKRCKTQNNGICSPGPDGEMYYGLLEQILKFSYLSFKTVLFRVKWFDTSNKGCIQNFVIRNNITKIKANGEAFKNDQYILATQVKQCFYLEDMARRPLGWKVIEHVSHKKFSNGGVIVVEDDPDVIHVENSSDLALPTSLNDLEIAALHIDGQSIDVDAPPDIIDVVDEDDYNIDEEDLIPNDLVDFNDEELVNLDIDNGVNVMSVDVARDHGSNDDGDDRKGTQKPNLGGKRAGRLHTRQETRNLGLKAITDKSSPVLIRELPLHYPSWRQMPPERKAGVVEKIGMETSATREYPSLIHTFFLTHTVGGVFLNPEDKALYDEMLRLQGLGSNTPTGVPYTEDEIMAIVRGGKQRGHIPGVGRVLPGQGTVIPPPSQSTHSTDIARLKKREKQLTKQVNMFMRLFRSDDKFSQMLNQFESQPEYGGGSGSGGCGDDEPGDDEDGGEDEDDS